MTSSLNSEEEVLKLISSVRRYPCLYNKQHPNYHNEEVNDCIWQMIGIELGIENKLCKRNWKSLKQRYRNGDVTETISQNLYFLEQFSKKTSENVISKESNPPPKDNAPHLDEQMTTNEPTSVLLPNPKFNKNSLPLLSVNDLQPNNTKSSQTQNIASVSLIDDDSDVEEIKPQIECIEIITSDETENESVNVSQKKRRKRTVSRKMQKKCDNIEDFSKFLKLVLENCRDYPPPLLSEVKDDIYQVVKKSNIKNRKKEKKKVIVL